MLSPPSAPKGPLEASDVHDKGCKLKWKKPDDNGGAPIRQYNIEKRDTKSAIPGKWDTVGKVPVSSLEPKDDLEFNVTGLTPNGEYEFRVTAVNDEGESTPLKTADHVIAKMPFVEASKPKNLEIFDWDKDHVKIKWAKPDKDGGAEITEYEIEVKEKSSKEWIKRKRVPASETTTIVEELKEGQTYEFRVRAVNKAGPGAPSDATKPFVVKSKYVKPFITGDQLKKITVKRGETFKYEIVFGGEPEPTVKWEKNGKQIVADGKRITIEKSGNKTILTVREAVRSDSGKYKLILSNVDGSLESLGEVTVLDKPSPPKGPLKVTDVHEFGCKLSWKKSEDDGGIQIKQYKIEKCDQKTNKWSSVTSVNVDITEYVVTGLSAGEFKFRVTAVNSEGESESLVTESWTITKKTEIKEMVAFKKEAGQDGADVGVETHITERKGNHVLLKLVMKDFNHFRLTFQSRY